MRNKLPFVFAGLIALLMIAGPIGYKRCHDKENRNFHVVEEGVLYRSGQMPLLRLQQYIAKHGIRTIVCLREGNALPDQQEEAWAKAKALKFVRIPPRQWYADEAGNVPADASVKAFREVMDDPANYPVLVHCFAGIHRTGAFCAVRRMDHDGFTNEEAIREMKNLGYTIEHMDVLPYLRNYRPW